jgi:glucan phosphoethanolaminetransferase (alkaline phosphatase superfamily)
MNEAELRKRVVRIALLVGGALMVVVIVFIQGLIPQRFLTWVFLAVTIAGYIAFYRLFRQAQKERRSAPESVAPLDEATRARYRRQILFFSMALAFFLCCLVYALWSSRGAPLLPRIAGATMNILIDVTLIATIFRLRRKLR